MGFFSRACWSVHSGYHCQHPGVLSSPVVTQALVLCRGVGGTSDCEPFFLFRKLTPIHCLITPLSMSQYSLIMAPSLPGEAIQGDSVKRQ